MINAEEWLHTLTATEAFPEAPFMIADNHGSVFRYGQSGKYYRHGVKTPHSWAFLPYQEVLQLLERGKPRQHIHLELLTDNRVCLQRCKVINTRFISGNTQIRKQNYRYP